MSILKGGLYRKNPSYCDKNIKIRIVENKKHILIMAIFLGFSPTSR